VLYDLQNYHLAPKEDSPLGLSSRILYALSVEIFFFSLIGVLTFASYGLGIRGLVIPLGLDGLFFIPLLALLILYEIKPQFIIKRIKEDEPDSYPYR